MKHFTLETFRIKKTGKFNVPFSPGHLFGSITRKTGGLMVDCGRVWMQGENEHLFQEFEKGEGWTGYDVLFLKLRFKGPQYVTFVIWDKGTKANIICVWDNNGYDGWETLTDQQAKVIEGVTKHIYDMGLPNPPVTYSFVNQNQN
jgi:hypothetical protein